MADKHELLGNTLTRDADGIKAECCCGWTSGGHFSSAAASVAFMTHQEDKEKEDAGHQNAG